MQHHTLDKSMAASQSNGWQFIVNLGRWLRVSYCNIPVNRRKIPVGIDLRTPTSST